MRSFKEKVLRIVAEIPKGETLTYREVAGRAGRPQAYRAVGNILSKNFDPRVPCYRVIRSDGQIGGYNGGREQKINILRKEGAFVE